MAGLEQLRDVALWPNWDLPDPPPEHPFKLIRRDGFCVGAFRDSSHATVFVRSLPRDLDRVISEARRLVAESGAESGAWMVPEQATPAGLVLRDPVR